MQVLTKNKKAFVFAAGVTAAAAGLYILFKKALEGGEPLDQINVEYQNGHLTAETILEIMSANVKQITPEFQKLFLNERQTRRGLEGDFDKYVEVCLASYEDFNALLVNGRKEILARLGISDQDWADSNSFYLENNNPEILAFYSNLQPNLKATIESTQEVSEDEFVAILSRHTELLELEGENIEKIAEIAQNRQKAVEVIQKRIGDKVFKEFGVEDEDFVVALKKYHDVPKAKGVMKIFLTLIKKLRTGGKQ